MKEERKEQFLSNLDDAKKEMVDAVDLLSIIIISDGKSMSVKRLTCIENSGFSYSCYFQLKSALKLLEENLMEDDEEIE